MFRMLESSGDSININCIDPLGRTALLMGIDNENLEMIELLLEYKVETKDALLHAIHEEYVEAVEVLLDHEESIHKEGDLWSWEVRQRVHLYSTLNRFLLGRGWRPRAGRAAARWCGWEPSGTQRR